jgi:hypothetical protein
MSADVHEVDGEAPRPPTKHVIERDHLDVES